MEKVKKWSNIRLIKRKLVMMFTSKKHMYRTINLYVFGKMKQKDNWIVFESFVEETIQTTKIYLPVPSEELRFQI